MNQAYQEAKSSNHGSMNISVKRKIYAKRQHGKRDRGSHPRTNKAQLTLGLQGCNAMGLEMLVAVVAAEKHFLAHMALVRALQFTCTQATEGDQHFILWLLRVAEGGCLLNCSTYTTLQAKCSFFFWFALIAIIVKISQIRSILKWSNFKKHSVKTATTKKPL